MIKFVNAKLNLGLNIIRRRPDGYHDLETVFYPVGLRNGTPVNPDPLCDILEVTPADETSFILTGRPVDCPLEKNLVYKAWKIFTESVDSPQSFRIQLDKHLPDGAGLGGGSADASFVLKTLNEMSGSPLSETQLEAVALRLGADCPFFIRNTPCFAQGVGERMQSVDLDLGGWWCALVKPDLSISTREAFAGVTPRRPAESLLDIVKLPVEQWQGRMVNDFEASLFPNHPVLAEIKEAMLRSGAAYASMSGSGSTIFGLFRAESAASAALSLFSRHYTALSLL